MAVYMAIPYEWHKEYFRAPKGKKLAILRYGWWRWNDAKKSEKRIWREHILECAVKMLKRLQDKTISNLARIHPFA